MALVIGVTLALAVGVFARWVGLDRERAFYPTVAIVVASYYVLFASMAELPAVLTIEILIGLGFVSVAVLGFTKSRWFAVVALGAHGLFDLFHPHAFSNPGVPSWWPNFCMAYDVAAAAYLAWQLRQPIPQSHRCR